MITNLKVDYSSKGTVSRLGSTFYFIATGEEVYTPVRAEHSVLFMELVNTAEERTNRKLTKKEIFRLINITEDQGD